MKPETESDNTAGAVAPAATCSTLAAANELIRQQQFLMDRQKGMLAAYDDHCRALAGAKEKLSRENHKLRKELDGYKRGRLWTMVASMLPTIEPRWRDEM